MSESTCTTPPDAGVRRACSAAQRRLWLLDRIDPGNAGLNLAVRWRLEGRISTAELQQAFAGMIARHPALRSRFADDAGVPVQVIEPRLHFGVRAEDLIALGEVAALAQAERLAQAEARAPFDLGVAPLLRVTHLRVREEVSIVCVTVHRIACDEASVAILARELGAACAVLSGAAAIELSPCREDLAPSPAPEPAGEGARRDEEFWAGALRGLAHFELHPDRPRPRVQTSNGQIVSRPAPPGLVAALQDLSRRQDGSLFTTTLAALFALLQRHSGDGDIAVGTPVAQRARGQRDVVGAFVDTLVLRADVSADPPFGDLLAQVQGTVAAALKHAGTPLERVIELLGPRRDLARSALFSVTYAVQEAQAGGNFGRFRLVALPRCSAGVLSELAFLLAETPAGWEVSCEYNADLFEPATVERLVAHFLRVLAAVAADPGQRLSALPLLDDAQRRSLVEERNRSAAQYPDSRTLPELFGDQAARTPEAIAVRCGEAGLSYGQLAAATRRLAHELRQRGVGRGSRVGICLERSPDLLVALLAVLEAGAAYVPLDPAYPPARLAQIVGDARPQVVLTTRALETLLPGHEAQVLRLDVEAARIARHPDAAGVAASGPAPDDVAYVIYTSGSTGRPKGVQVRHRGLTNLLWAMRHAPGLSAADALLAVTTVSFDIAALELFLPLVVGARVVIATAAEAGDGAALVHLLRRHRVTVLQATPVTWQILLAAGWDGDPALKMLCGGEALARELADALLATGGELWNLYGPTETTIWSSALRVERGAGPVPIGPPIANTQFYVLDAQGGLAPPGAPGELFIGGDGVALGYQNRPELTHERFVPDRFGPRAGGRLYRTGDRVRWCAGGLEFLGRDDHQVKLRGHRIELGEIEAVLRAQPQVSDAVAVLGTAASGEPAIHAYVAASGARAALGDALRASLLQALPGYMCPAAVVVLKALPRTPNGKLDRAALPVPAPAAAPEPQRPRNALERRLARDWSAVLGVADVDVNANFFEIGGHSLLAVRLLARIEASFGHRLTLAALFRHATVAAQARLLERADPRAFDFRQVVQLQPGGTRPPLIAINNTGIYYNLSRRLGSDQPFTSLQLFDPARPQATLPRTLEDIAAAYAQLIRRVQHTGPYALLGWCVAGTLAFEVARQLRVAGHVVSHLILFDSLAPGCMARMPWPRSVLAGYAYRAHLIAADWRRTRAQGGGLRAFLGRRLAVRSLLRMLGRSPPAVRVSSGEGAPLDPEQYDQWLLGYLEDAAAAYQPRPYPGAMTLFRSAAEPAGVFLDPCMGWGGFVRDGIDVVALDGDHFSMFQEPGVSDMARHIAAVARVP